MHKLPVLTPGQVAPISGERRDSLRRGEQADLQAIANERDPLHVTAEHAATLHPMRLIFDDPDPDRRDDSFGINDRTDGGSSIVSNGDTFEVADARARFLISRYWPRLRTAGEPHPDSTRAP